MYTRPEEPQTTPPQQTTSKTSLDLDLIKTENGCSKSWWQWSIAGF